MRIMLRKRITVRGPTNERGQTMTEYALILAAIAIVAIVVIVAYTTMGTQISTLVNQVIACL
jgi:Flp pilus assembly pilin Flp